MCSDLCGHQEWFVGIHAGETPIDKVVFLKKKKIKLKWKSLKFGLNIIETFLLEKDFQTALQESGTQDSDEKTSPWSGLLSSAQPGPLLNL